jgi:ParB/RepB/Spo0J family partition protein
MRIPIEQILPDPDIYDQDKKGSRPGELRPESRPSGARRPPVVVKDTRGRYMLVAGARQWRAARDAGEREIDCTVKDGLSDQEREEMRLAEMYHNALVPPMELGKAFMRYRDSYTVTQQELARRTGITPGTIHHYESLIRTLDPDLGRKVDSGELTFKEARSIADILDHVRQREIAAPFLDGRLSSVHVERVVGRAKNAPSVPIEQLIEEVLNGARAAEPAHEPAPVIAPPTPVAPRPDTDSIENSVLKLAGEIDALRLQTIPEYRRLKLISSLRILDSRLKSSLAHLNGGQAAASDRPRPLGHVGV